MQRTHFDQESEQHLRASLQALRCGESVLSYHQLQGLLFAIACSPEPVKPAEWFDLIWLTDEPQFDAEEDARGFYQLVLALSDYIAGMARQHRFLPFSAQFSEHWQDELIEWCDGLLRGHQYLEDVWYIAMDDLNDQELAAEVDTTLNLAATFADLLDSQQLSFDDDLALGRSHLSQAYALLHQALSSYASVGELWAQSHAEFDTEQMFLALESVAREELCPCGSGLVFGQCCLH